MQTSPTVGQIATALASFHAEVKNPQKDREVSVVSQRTGARYTFQYATLASVMDAIRVPLAKNGLSIVQVVEGGKGARKLSTTLLHSSGEFISSEMDLEVEGSGNQATGSAISYCRRYAMLAICSIVADEDDDGNLGDGNDATVRHHQARPTAQQKTFPQTPQPAVGKPAPAPAEDEHSPQVDATKEEISTVSLDDIKGLARQIGKTKAIKLASSQLGRTILSADEIKTAEYPIVYATFHAALAS